MALCTSINPLSLFFVDINMKDHRLTEIRFIYAYDKVLHVGTHGCSSLVYLAIANTQSQAFS